MRQQPSHPTVQYHLTDRCDQICSRICFLAETMEVHLPTPKEQRLLGSVKTPLKGFSTFIIASSLTKKKKKT